MIGFVYKWVNSVNGKWYIGSHKGITDDGYRHSSKIMKLAETKYGLDNFVRCILYQGENFRVVEGKYLHKYDAASNLMSYNRSNLTGPNQMSKESIEKRAASQRGQKRQPQSKESCQKKSDSLRGRSYNELFGKEKAKELRATKGLWAKGKTLEELHGKEKAKILKKEISNRMKGNIPCNRGFRYEARIAGKNTYITNTPCIRGHISERNTITGQCKKCLSFLYRTRYRQNNKEKYNDTTI